jgi:K+-sensing histidine kinase KdpD
MGWPIRYGGASLSVLAAVLLWTASSLIHKDPFAVFLLSVVFTARFFGFGPAVFGTALSVAAIDFVAYEPRFSMGVQSSDFPASLARSRAPKCAPTAASNRSPPL